ncbi:TPA: hypothetical protein DCW38_07715 [candidate division WOR-3 bacterium]|jgi:hypothetical protein|uniref:Uncharacterized protein n=1 Tax=candidate division WOR-3 bacterium TaxID=2052148 RepID=A0A350HBY1_UNCW3|nr:hypothetical protein [candidate division WOR-3 bacterium]
MIGLYRRKKLKKKKEEIERFLETFKMMMKTIGFRLIPREKNLQSLADLKISYDSAKNEINKLTYINYESGPLTDHEKKNKNVWIFGIVLGNKEVYIKLSDDFEHVAKCLSFHEAKETLKKPMEKS